MSPPGVEPGLSRPRRDAQLPQHVHHAYTTAGGTTQVPMFIHLLKQIQYPQANILEQELTQGFKLMGQLQPGTNWYIRTDQKYLQPRSSEQFADHNQQYVLRKLAFPRVDDHYEFMLAEIVQEVKAGRMNGPYRQPPSWTTKTIAPAGYDLALLHYRTITPRSPWHLASSRQGQMARIRFAGEKTGAAAAITPHASCTTSLSTTPRITSHPW